MMEIQPDLSLCLVPEDKGADLSPCLEALFACTDPLSLEVFVPRDARCGEYDSSHHLHPVNQPFKTNAAYVNEVWQRGRGRYLGLWHSGVIAQPASLISLVEFLDDHPDVAVAGPRFFNKEGDILTSTFQSSIFASDSAMPGWDGLTTMEVGWLSGAALVMNRLALEDISLPVSELGGMWERHLCRRLRKQGWHVFFVHLARVVGRDVFCRPSTIWQLVENAVVQLARSIAR